MILNFSSEMSYCKHVVSLQNYITFLWFKGIVKFSSYISNRKVIFPFNHVIQIIHNWKYRRLLINTFNYWYTFWIVFEFNMIYLYFFSSILFYFIFKHMRVKLLLKFLIGKIDTKLFKGIIFEYFKTKNIKYSNKFWIFSYFSLWMDHCVDFMKYPLEKISIHYFSKRISLIFTFKFR